MFPSRLVLVIDQLEELFTLESITPEARANFIVAIAALARSGRVAVLAILRSDFFEKCAELPLLAELSKGGGLHHLLPPNPLEIGQMIREPAVAAGLQFEIHPETKQFLDERLRDATRNPEALKQWSTALINQGDVFTDQGDLDAALKCYQESLSIRQNLFQQNSQSTESQRDVGTALSKIAGNRHARGNFASELANYEQALAIRRGVVKTKPENQEFSP